MELVTFRDVQVRGSYSEEISVNPFAIESIFPSGEKVGLRRKESVTSITLKSGLSFTTPEPYGDCVAKVLAVETRRQLHVDGHPRVGGHANAEKR